MKVRLGGPMPQEAVEVLDVSLKGIGLKVPYALAAGQELVIKVAHPILEDLLTLRVAVAWCRMKPGDPVPHAGLEILTSTDADRMCLRRIQAAEVSVRVIDKERVVGFVMNQAEGRWALYDENTVKVALLQSQEGRYQVSFIGTRPDESIFELDSESLAGALAAAFELDAQPFIIPPEGGNWHPIRASDPPRERPKKPAPPSLPTPPKVPKRDEIAPNERPPSKQKRETSTFEAVQLGNPKAFHTVKASGYHVGYVAVTSIDDVWSLYDEAWSEVAIMTPDEGSYKLAFVGKDPSDSLDFLMSKTFLGGVQMAFDLRVEPEIDPPLLAALDPSDSSSSESPEESKLPSPSAAESGDDLPLAQDADHHTIMDADMGLLGYLAKDPAVRDRWSVYVTTRDKVATVERDGARWKILFCGGAPTDSLEYMMAKTFRGALALTFDLESLPTLDPPVE